MVQGTLQTRLRSADTPVLVPEPLLEGLRCVGRHAHQDDIGRVARQPAESARNARRDGHLPRRERLARMPRLRALLELVVDAEARERVGHLPQDRGRETGVGAASQA